MTEKLHSILKKKDVPEYKKILSKNSLILFALCILQLVMAILGSLLGLDEYKEFFGSVYLIFCVIAIALVYKIDKNLVLDNERQVSKMKPLTFIKCFTAMVGTMLIFTVPTVIIDVTLSFFGYTIENIASANSFSDSITDFLYISFLGPICEEVLFRGLIQKTLQKFTPFIAIFTSAIMFGIYHGNFGQIFPMVGVGIVLGYVAYKYSMKWSIIIHIIYNLCIGELFGLLTEFLEKDGEEFLLPIVNLTPFVFTVLILSCVGLFFLVKKLFFEKNFLEKYKIKISKFLIPLTSIGFLLFTSYNLVTAIMLIEKLQV